MRILDQAGLVDERRVLFGCNGLGRQSTLRAFQIPHFNTNLVMCEECNRIENDDETDGLWSHGWLMVIAYFTVYSWTRWISPNGYAGFYRRVRTQEGKVKEKGRIMIQDGLHLIFAVASVTGLLVLGKPFDRDSWLAGLLFGFATFKMIDLFFDFVMLAVFGNRYGRPWQGSMEPRRLHRTLILNLLLLVELVFWNATWIYCAAGHCPCLYSAQVVAPADALQLSMATVTTIGYGTYAPVHLLSVCHSFFQSVCALLLLTGVAGGIFSRNAAVTAAEPTTTERKLDDSGSPPAGKATAKAAYEMPTIWTKDWGWDLRGYLPVGAPIVLTFLFMALVPRLIQLACCR